MEKYIVLFGAGMNGQHIWGEVRARFPEIPLLFCDNSSEKQKTQYNGTDIVDFQSLLELYKNEQIDRIILTMSYEREILHQCVSGGIDVKDLCYWEETYHMPRFIGEKYRKEIYAQDGEEIFLKELFDQKKKGTYVDIGANHPFRFSNTNWAYVRGWRGINIEPDLVNYELLKHIRKEDINLNCGISDKETQLDYYVFRENVLNTFCEDEIENRDNIIEIRKIPVRRMDSVLREYDIHEIDYIDIDVEGMELQVLNSIDWESVNIRCILLEQKALSLYGVLESEACKLLRTKGYIPVNKYNRTVIYIPE